MGLLDLFDSPDIIGRLLGISDPGGVGSGNLNLGTGSQMAAAPPPTGAAPNPPADWTSFPNPGPRPDPNSGNIAATLPPPAGGGGGGLITPAQAAPSPGGPPPPAAVPYQNIGGLPANPPPAGPPMSINPPSQGPGYGSTSGSLARQFGLTPEALRAANPIPANSPVTNFLGGLGRGLTAVGNLRPGASGAQAFAAGAGGGLTGGLRENDLQQAQARQAKNDLFNQSSIAFRDMLAAQSADDMEGYRQAQGEYLRARATAAKMGGTAWQTATPYGRTIQVENEALKMEAQLATSRRAAASRYGWTPDQEQQQIDKDQQKVDAFRQRLYKTAGINPDDAAKLKDMGTSSDKPFQTKGMTLDQFNTDVPMGAWYTDQNGKARQRTVPPGGMNNLGQQPQQQTSSDNYTSDMMANTPAYDPTAYGQAA